MLQIARHFQQPCYLFTAQYDGQLRRSFHPREFAYFSRLFQNSR